MTIEVYKQQLYDACMKHSLLAQQALDYYFLAETDQERERARKDNIKHLAAYNALQWALVKEIDIQQEVKQAKIDVLNKLRKECGSVGVIALTDHDIDKMIEEYRK